MKVLIVVGARPNFMKAAPLVSAIERHNEQMAKASMGGEVQSSMEEVRCVLVHTGQHYDEHMSDCFFADLRLSKPDVHLGVGSGSHAVQTAEIMKRFEPVLLQERPDAMIVVGDVNSTLACALVAAKLSLEGSGKRPLIAHVEAGLRSFDRTMPEEMNRILTDQMSDLLFVTEESALGNLAHEGVAQDKVHFVGNTMIDSLLACKDRAKESTVLDDLGLRNGAGGSNGRGGVLPYVLATVHRPANVDSYDAFLNILEALEDAARQMTVVFPAHPRTQRRIKEFGLEARFRQAGKVNGGGTADARVTMGAIRMLDPLGYVDCLCLMSHAALVVTDSGGIQEETTCLGVPCVTVRENTERPVTVSMGTNVIAGVQKEGIRAAIQRQLVTKPSGRVPQYWDGQSAGRIIAVIEQTVRKRRAAAANDTSTVEWSRVAPGRETTAGAPQSPQGAAAAAGAAPGAFIQ
jgi:UDP-N-acetylglucosamine 2-epimerase (non-hydrolysing)